MYNGVNPYQPSVSTPGMAREHNPATSHEWEGRSFSIHAVQAYWTLWLAARCYLVIDDHEIHAFTKWRWNSRFEFTLEHRDRAIAARLECSGAKRIRYRLICEETVVGESSVLSKLFWLGLIVELIFALGSSLLCWRYVSGIDG